MDALATLFVSAVMFFSAMAPSAQIPQVLGVQVAQAPSRDPEVIQEMIRVRNQNTEEVRETANEKLREVREKREQLRQEIQERREEATQAAETRREQFRERLSEIDDTRQRTALQNITNRFTNINTKWVDKWNSSLTRISEILAKAETRIDELEQEGHDVSELRILLAEAEDRIAEAQEAIEEQAGNVYVPELDDAEGIGGEVVSLVTQFKDDLNEIRDALLEAREATGSVIEGIRELENE